MTINPSKPRSRRQGIDQSPEAEHRDTKQEQENEIPQSREVERGIQHRRQ